MSPSVGIDDLFETIAWARNAVGINWPDNVSITPDRRDAWIMEAYEHVAIVRRDLDSGDDCGLPSLEILSRDFQWSDGHAAAWFSGLRHANYLAWDCACRATTAQKQGLTAVADMLAREAEEICLPMASKLLADQRAERVIGRARIVNRWAAALTTVVWARSGLSDQRAGHFLDQLFAVARDQMDLPNVINAVAMLVPYALEETEEADAAPERQRLIKMAESLLIRDYCGIDEYFNHCELAGTIALIIQKNSKDRRTQGFSTIIDLLRRADRKDISSLEYTTYQLLRLLQLFASETGLSSFHPIANDLLDALISFNSADAVDVLTGNLKSFEVIWALLSESVQLKIIEQAWCVPRPHLDAEGLARLIPALRAMAEWSGATGFHRSWKYAVSAVDSSGFLWAIASKAVLETSYRKSRDLVDITGSTHLIEAYMANEDAPFSEPLIDYFKTVVGRAYAGFASDLDAQLAWASSDRSTSWEVAAWSLLVGIAVDDPMSEVNKHPERWAKALQDLLKKHPPSDRPSAFLFVRGLSRLAEITGSSDPDRSKHLQLDVDHIARIWFETQDVPYVSVSLKILDAHLCSALLGRWMSCNRLSDGPKWVRMVADRFSARGKANVSNAVSHNSIAAYIRQWYAMMFEEWDAFEREVGDLQIDQFRDVAVPEGLVVALPSYVQSMSSLIQSSATEDLLIALEPWQQTDALTLIDLLDDGIKQNLGVNFESITVSVATAQVAWWPDVSLFRVRDAKWPKGTALFFARHKNWLVRLDGNSQPIHELNVRCPIELSEAAVLDYLRFFTTFVQGEEGAFWLVDGRDSPLIRGDWAAVDGPLTKHIRRPVYLGRNRLDDFICWGTVLYGGCLFHAEFRVGRDGSVDMLCDDLIAIETGLSAMFSLSLT